MCFGLLAVSHAVPAMADLASAAGTITTQATAVGKTAKVVGMLLGLIMFIGAMSAIAQAKKQPGQPIGGYLAIAVVGAILFSISSFFALAAPSMGLTSESDVF
jgi:hypothetical protein